MMAAHPFAPAIAALERELADLQGQMRAIATELEVLRRPAPPGANAAGTAPSPPAAEMLPAVPDLPDPPDAAPDHLVEPPGPGEEPAVLGKPAGRGGPGRGRNWRKGQPDPAKAERDANVVRGFAAGEAVAVLAKRYFVTTTTIYNILDAAGLDRRVPRKAIRPPDPPPASPPPSMPAGGRTMAEVMEEEGQAVAAAALAPDREPAGPKPEPVTHFEPEEPIDLNRVDSAMDARARDTGAARSAGIQAREADDGKVWCGPCDARVPLWFGRDCICGTCPLKGGAYG